MLGRGDHGGAVEGRVGEAGLDKADLWHISLGGQFQYLDN